MKEIKICYIGGGSKDWARKYFSDLLLQGNLCGEIGLYDIDLRAAKLNEAYFNVLKKQNKKKCKSNWNCVVYEKIEDGLKNADVVLISILPYSLDNMAVDVHYAEKYGVYQSVGDTVGVGGYSRALRTLDAIMGFASKIKEICPNAWVINYTNPMSMCTNAMFKVFPEIKGFGCCHEVFRAQKLICGVYGMYNTLSDEYKKAFLESNLKLTLEGLRKAHKSFSMFRHPKLDRHNIRTNVQGVNHFTLIDSATYKDEDILKIYHAFIPMYKEYYKKSPSIVQYDMFERYDIVGAAGDRHLAEFIPEDYLPLYQNKYGKQGFKLTTVKWRKTRDKIRRLYLKLVSLKLFPSTIIPTGEEGVLQLQALYGFGDLVSNANTINNGQSPSLPLGTAVETNCLFSLNNVEVMNCGEIKNKFLRERESLHALNQKEFVDYFYKKDKEGLRKVFMRDPSVSRLDPNTSSKLFDELIELNKECLDSWLLK